MAGPNFTRDEIILTLDTLYSLPDGRLSAKSQLMLELSELLRSLPIHSGKNRARSDFRSPEGITNQLRRFQRSLKKPDNNEQVGTLFFEVAREYASKKDELHQLATAIKRNNKYYEWRFGDVKENDSFPEGILLGHLHRIIEKRDGSSAPLLDHCEICNFKPLLSYRVENSFLQQHLLISPCDMVASKKYSPEFFITVCPNCHEALHRYRPWRNRENCEDILR